MMYVKISRAGLGSYIQPLELLNDTLEAEFDGVEEWAEDGDSLTVSFIEMDEDEYAELEEFSGW